MCHVPYTAATRHRETETAMRDLAMAYKCRTAETDNPALMASAAWRYFRLATDPLGHLPA